MKSTLARSTRSTPVAPTALPPRPSLVQLAGLFAGTALPMLATGHGAGGQAARHPTRQSHLPGRAGDAAVLGVPRQAGAGLSGGRPHAYLHARGATGLGAGAGAAQVARLAASGHPGGQNTQPRGHCPRMDQVSDPPPGKPTFRNKGTGACKTGKRPRFRPDRGRISCTSDAMVRDAPFADVRRTNHGRGTDQAWTFNGPRLDV